jgi:hypothetical protein
VAKRKPELQKPKAYSIESKLRFTPKQAAQEYKWAIELYESRKRFVDHVLIALQTRSPTRRRQLYEDWRKSYGDDVARSYAKYAESVYAGGDTTLLDRFRQMTQTKPEPIPDYMILKDDDVTGKQA